MTDTKKAPEANSIDNEKDVRRTQAQNPSPDQLQPADGDAGAEDESVDEDAAEEDEDEEDDEEAPAQA